MTRLLDLGTGWAGRFGPAKPNRLRKILRTGLLMLISAAVIPGHTSPSQDQAAQVTQALIAQQQKFAQAQGLTKSQQLVRLVELAEKRHALLSQLAETDPAQLFRVVIPEEQRAGMPADVEEMLLNQQAIIEGRLEARYDDYEDGGHELHHVFETAAGERFSVHFTGQPAEFPAGSIVRAKGLLLASGDSGETDGDLIVEGGSGNIEILECCTSGGSGSSTSFTPELGNTFGDKSALVILVNFRNAPGDMPWSAAQVEQVVFGEINEFFVEASYGQASISGAVVDWTTIDQDSSTCQPDQLASMANDNAIANGYDPLNYDRLVYVFPKNACGFSGSAYIEGNISWINGTIDNRVIAHELAHNLGLYHSESLECGEEVASGSCSTIFYGDMLDTMGTGNNAHFNAFQKERLGWLHPEDIVEVTTGGSYQLKPYETVPDGSPMALKVLRSIDATTGRKNWFYLEYRQPIGFDANLASVSSGNIYSGVLLHAATESNASSSHLLDANPGSDTRGNYFDWLDPALTVGSSISESASGIYISTDLADSIGAEVTIQVNASACTTGSSSLVLDSPIVVPWVSAGTTVNYAFTLINGDSVNCPPAEFSLVASAQSGWTTQFNTPAITLAPGASGTVILAVTSPSSAVDGYYDIELMADNGTNSAGSMATYVVSNPPQNSVPVANDDSATTEADTVVTIDVLANDSDADGDALSLTSLSGGNGSTSLGANNSVRFTPAAGFTGQTSFTYTVSDGNGGSDSALVNVTVTSSSQNSAPQAVNDRVEITSTTAVTINVLANDTDPDNDALTITGFSQGAKGSVSANANGTLTYNPARKFKDVDTFTYTISDGALSATATVTVVLVSEGDGSTGGGSTGGGGKGKNRK